jgi:hypothetical protein
MPHRKSAFKLLTANDFLLKEEWVHRWQGCAKAKAGGGREGIYSGKCA